MSKRHIEPIVLPTRPAGCQYVGAGPERMPKLANHRGYRHSHNAVQARLNELREHDRKFKASC